MQENIQVFEGDNPYDLARDFAVRHNLDLRLTDLLATQIQSNIDQVIIQEGDARAYEAEQMLMYEGQQQQEQHYYEASEDQAIPYANDQIEEHHDQYASPNVGEVIEEEDEQADHSHQEMMQYYSPPPNG